MTIIIVRHGETNENKNQTVQTVNVPLSENGHVQATLLAGRLATFNIEKIISSDIVRAQQTAIHVNRRHNLDIDYTALLHERSFGDLRGQTYAEIGFDFFVQDYQPPNGESWSQFASRVAESWQYIIEQAHQVTGDLLVVTHGLVCRELVSSHIKVDSSLEVPERWANTSITEVENAAPFNAIRINCDAHIVDKSQRSSLVAPV